MTARAWARRLGSLVGLALLVAAVVVVWRRREEVTAALAALRSRAPLAVAILLLSVVANIALTALLLRHLLSRYGRVGVGEMQAVIASAALLNYLPLRPGLVGRLAYHRVVNGIPAADTLRTMIQAAALSAVTALYLSAGLLAAGGRPTAVALVVAAPVVVLPLAACARPARHWSAAALLRYVDVLVAGVRYTVAFHLIGLPLGPSAALVFASVSVLATLVPFVSNGLGLREWAIGLLAPLLTVHQFELGVTAELVNRAGEIVVIVALGSVATAWVTRTWRAGRG